MTEIQEQLFALQDIGYRDFQRKLIPTIDPETIIGVRTPQLRHLAKEAGQGTELLSQLPHRYFEENQLHSFALSAGKEFSAVISGVEAFLPYVDNWATCDQLSPRVFRKHREELLPCIRRWIRSQHTYTVRFAMKMLMDHFLEEDFDPEFPELVASVTSAEYYIRMMQAWYFATALAKQYDKALPCLSEQRLDRWTHNKAIQKAIESYRITPERKAYLKTLRVK